MRSTSLICCFLVMICFGGEMARAQAPTVARVESAGFEENIGQYATTAPYVGRSRNVFVAADARGLSLAVAGVGDEAAAGLAIRLESEAAKDAHVRAGRRGATRVNHFIGNDRTKWRTDIATFDHVVIDEFGAGCDLVAHPPRTAGFKYDVELDATASIDSIAIRARGVGALSIAENGDLLMATPAGTVRQSIPAAWQIDESGRRDDLRCGFRILADGRFGFSAPDRRPGTRVVIDPFLNFVAVVGTTANDLGGDCAVALNGQMTIVTNAFSSAAISFGVPTPPPGYQPGPIAAGASGGSECFIATLAANGNSVLYATFLGGSGVDQSGAIAVDMAGRIVIGGITTSANLPITNGVGNVAAFQPIHAECLSGCPGNVAPFYDGFLTILDPTQTGNAQLVYSTFFGGSFQDEVAAIVLQGGTMTSLPTISCCGFTYSNNLPFAMIAPVATNSYRATAPGARDGWVARIDPNLAGNAQLTFGSYVGSSTDDSCYDLGVRPNGEIVVVGAATNGTGPAFLQTATNPNPMAGAYQPVPRGGPVANPFDAFVAVFDPSQSGSAQLLAATFLGGDQNDQASAVFADPSGIVTVTGFTYTPNNAVFPFPTTTNAFDTTYAGLGDAFIAQLSPNLGTLVYSTYYGGSLDDTLECVVVDGVGGIIAGGYRGGTGHPALSIPVIGSLSGTNDVLFVRIDPSAAPANQLTFNVAAGSPSMSHSCRSVALSCGGIMTAFCWGDLPLPTPGATSASPIGSGAGSDVFILQFCPGGTVPGQANGPTASMTINGLGTGTAPGPFAVQIPGLSGGPLVMTISGQPGQASVFAIAVGPLNVGATAQLPGFGQVDIGTAPGFFNVVIICPGLVPPFTALCAVSPGGVGVAAFTVPALPVGTLFAIQTVVFGTGPSYPFGAAMTAAFEVCII